MSRSTILRLLTALVILASTAVGPTATEARPLQGVDMQTPDDDAAIDDLVGCLRGSQHLLALFLIDESASLKNSDPDDRRVDAAGSALDSLTSLANAGNTTPPVIEVALAAFANEFSEAISWTSLADDGASEVQGVLDGFRDRKHGIDTDFVNALSAGRELLADRAAELTSSGASAPCRAVFLFTDGGYDLAVRQTQADIDRLGLTKTYAPDIELTNEEDVRRAEKAGREEMCREGGLADRVRGDDITLVTLALASNVPPMAQRLLAAASAGEALGYTCGRPQERPTGAYLPTEGVDVLIARFHEVATRLAGGTLLADEKAYTLCDGEVCPEGTTSFELDGSLRRAHLLALAEQPGLQLQLEGPGGSLTVAEPGDYELGGVAVEVAGVADRGFAVDLHRPADAEGWNGPWSASVIDPSGDHAGAPATLQVYVFSDITVALGDIERLVRGEATPITATLQLPSGEDDDLGTTVTAATVTARFTDPVSGEVSSVELAGPPTGPFLGSFAVPAELTSNALVATVELTATTDTRAEISSQTAPQELLVDRPEGSVQFRPGSLQLSSVTNHGTTTGELLVVGGSAPGCVWFGPTEATNLPEGASSLRVTVDGDEPPAEGGCIPVGAGEQLALPITIDPDGRGTGSVTGVLELHERVEGAEASTTALPFRFDLARGVDQTQRLLLTFALLAAGIALPLVLLLIINNLGARFQALDVVRATAIPVTLQDGAVVRLDRNRSRRLTLGPSEFESLSGSGSVKRFRVGGVEFRAKASRNPFGGTVALAAPEGGAEKLKGNEGSRVELDPSLAGSWVFLLDADRTRASRASAPIGTLIAFASEGDASAQLNRMLSDVQSRLPSIALRLGALVHQSPAKAKPARSARRNKRAAGSPTQEAASEVTGEPTEGGGLGESHAAVETADEDATPSSTDTDTDAASTERTENEAGTPQVGSAPAAEPDTAASAPLGFGGRAAARPEPSGEDGNGDGTGSGEDGDDPDAGPPVGFGGRPLA